MSELSSALQTATAENTRLEAERSRLDTELKATLKKWKEDVEKVKKECAEEIERRGKEIYEVRSSWCVCSCMRTVSKAFQKNSTDMIVHADHWVNLMLLA